MSVALQIASSLSKMLPPPLSCVCVTSDIQCIANNSILDMQSGVIGYVCSCSQSGQQLKLATNVYNVGIDLEIYSGTSLFFRANCYTNGC